MKQKMEKMQVLNDGADEEDFNELLKILRSFGEVEVLYDPSNPKDKDVTADEVIEKYDNFKKKVKMDTNTLNGIDDEKIGKMDPTQRDAYQILLKELENAGEEAEPTRQILQLALQLDEKGEFYKFIEVFGDSRIDAKTVL